jgi:hypothetical protein
MTPRVADPPSTLTEAETFALAALEVKNAAGLLTGRDERIHWKALKAGGSPVPSHKLTLGGRVVTRYTYQQFAARALNAAKNGSAVFITEDVPLADLNGGEVKTLLRQGSATSVGAFQSLDTSRQYDPTRRPLDVLDLVRLGTTDEAAVPYMRQTTYAPPRSKSPRPRRPRRVRSPRPRCRSRRCRPG